MGRKPYRVEIEFPKKGRPKYFLVKDVWFNRRKRKAKKYLGVEKPTTASVDQARRKYAADLEMKAAYKKAELSSSFHKSLHMSKNQLVELEKLRWLYKAFMDLLTVDEVEAYQRDFEVHYVQGTTSIEGNTLSLTEAANLLLHGIAPDRKSLREINEVQNYIRVAKYRDRYKGKVTVDLIMTLHRLIMNNIDFESAGVFRRIDTIGIEGCDLSVTPSVMIGSELERIISDYYSNIEQGFHPFEQAALFHYHFEMLHPFIDGNGRVGREVFNYMLSKSQFPRLLFLGKDRDDYIRALQHGNAERFSKMVSIFAKVIHRQRMGLLEQNIRKVAEPMRRTGQVSLDDFVRV